MNISLASANPLIKEKQFPLKEILGCGIREIVRIQSGLNSRVYCCLCSDSKRYIVKRYFYHPQDQRDRLGVEFLSLSFLHRQGLRRIPRPLEMLRDEGCAIYEYIEGNKILSSQVTSEDIDEAGRFIQDLKKSTQAKESRNFKPASEAFFSTVDIIQNIRDRFHRFTSLDGQQKLEAELNNFLSNDFGPLLNDVIHWGQSGLREENISIDKEIEWSQRTFSPSDFGFHNALRDKNGRLIFLDFEYFGWDDPAKMISDFLLHPAMDLREELKRRFVRNMLEIFQDDQDLIKRLRVLYPLFGLKWCLILLNEFIPEDSQRRDFAAVKGLEDKEKLLKTQLAKAQGMYRNVKTVYQEFPYDIE